MSPDNRLDQSPSPRPDGKSAAAFRTISEVASELEVPQHVLRFWESKFSQVRPLKRGGGRRYYRPEDIKLLRHIRELLYSEGYTIRGVQKLLRERGAKGAESDKNAVDLAGPATADQKHKSEPAPKQEAAPISASKAVSREFDSSRRAELELVMEELETLRDLLRPKKS